MSETNGAPADLPRSDLDAGQVLTGLLQLIKDTTTVADITAERVESLVGIPVDRSSDRSFGYGARLTPDWSYRLDFSADRFLTSLDFTLFDNHGTDSGSMADVCQVDFDEFAAALEASGFQRTVRWGSHGALRGADFRRDGLWVQAIIRGESEQAPTHHCIRIVQVRADD